MEADLRSVLFVPCENHPVRALSFFFFLRSVQNFAYAPQDVASCISPLPLIQRNAVKNKQQQINDVFFKGLCDIGRNSEFKHTVGKHEAEIGFCFGMTN